MLQTADDTQLLCLKDAGRKLIDQVINYITASLIRSNVSFEASKASSENLKSHNGNYMNFEAAMKIFRSENTPSP